jgi:hypothetical protein
MMDMTAVIVPKSDQINADDLIPGPRTYTITGVQISAGQEQPVSINLAGEGRVFRPCKSMSRVLVAAWGPDANAYTGRSLTLYRDPKVKWGGLEVGGIRISHMTHIDQPMTMMLSASKANRQPHRVQVLKVAPPVDHAAAARAAADQGTEAFRAWWKDASPDARAAAKPIMETLQNAATAADARATMTGDEPFGLPTPDQLAAAEAAALAARDAQDREGGAV